jgi:dTDP-4-amino-4,6-dideoxygalactose transaminase
MIRLAHPRFLEADLDRLRPILRSGRLVQGPVVAAFERACAERLGVDSCVAVASGTAALHLAMHLAGVGPARRVALPVFAWPAAANVAEHLGAQVVGVDIDPADLNVDLAELEGAVARGVDLAVPIHLFGRPLWSAETRRRLAGVPVVEDAACAFAAVDRDGVAAGTWGELGCFSFHPRKGLTTGEGGLILAKDPAHRERLTRLRNHGMARSEAGLACLEPGLNYRLGELAAALGLAQLERFDDALAIRRRLARAYTARLENVPGVRLLEGHRLDSGSNESDHLDNSGHVFQSFTVVLDDAVDRRRCLRALAERGVEGGVASFALHLMPYYREKYGYRPDDFPVARWAHHQLLVLPLHEQLEEGDIERVVDALEWAVAQSRRAT